MIKNKKIIISAGGTGGHIMPGITIANLLMKSNWEVIWVGNSNNMEAFLVPKHGIKFYSINCIGLKRNKFQLIEFLKFIFTLLKSFFISFKLIKKFKPDIVLGFGGYVSFPCSFIAYLMGYKVILHEQNIIPGYANKVLAKFIKYKFSGFPNVFKDSYYIGNPIRDDILLYNDPLKRYSNRTGPLKILVLGGSLGAQTLNILIPKALSLINFNIRPIVTHQSGLVHIDSLKNIYSQYNVRATCIPFIEDIAYQMSENDLIICRSGGMTIAEICAIGVATLFVPFPYAADNHQLENAKFLEQNNVAWLKEEKDLNPKNLSLWLKDLDRKKLQNMAINIQKYSKPMASKNLADFCELLKDNINEK
ncbi:UDP-N-acetylglucosamine--N-acetylmuramyl- (pentapeptide) pyrophosphoryl-undecaprenol N-acetylglucosamine transferase [Candidatus Kinetoplastibacterium sorsogonicusi]|uniref:UDP-N-acetylglucosamine--N-acetylmuramyl-(pentapeptide) pyrophosphoryl-undecaprenol N-acetylglucosamine transferase n=1 Tax=Candidatus Kinetoplastidibacterium kentomonadis TaxID=1576550 RepID=A0A3S7JAG2_9PROT|nr:undecaprenyldiphospho-muramoylpentapeptide beta-N-acetylglucosaminyltransferase [Candidatus Kinetoplastibacterium sorsogonicusi]AWD32659.1 UDP-N-acetylglucosamine--N-acetylmuramyl- (pentapeptide) pyrophosphoryl-undecaprenol N-acetylglucosamine transferase [Candidatus Kinetoplastibacterium sorsogonicusi]